MRTFYYGMMGFIGLMMVVNVAAFTKSVVYDLDWIGLVYFLPIGALCLSAHQIRQSYLLSRKNQEKLLEKLAELELQWGMLALNQQHYQQDYYTKKMALKAANSRNNTVGDINE